MADKRIGELPAASAIYDDTLFAAEQQGKAVKITGRQIRRAAGSTGSTGSGGTGSGDSSSGGFGGDYIGGGYVEMTASVPVSERKVDTLYGKILKTYS